MRGRFGYAAWIVGVVQFFVVHVITQSAWAEPYSWARNNISDLGNVHCALQSEPEPRYVCSPEHGLMNTSFAVLGVLLVVGVVLTGRAVWRRGPAAAAARVLLAGAGVGFVLAGLAPADADENMHVLGALLIMATGNIGLLLAGLGLASSPASRWATALLGSAAATALGLFLSHHHLGLGMGGMERVAAFPLLAWALAVGVFGLAGRRSGAAALDSVEDEPGRRSQNGAHRRSPVHPAPDQWRQDSVNAATTRSVRRRPAEPSASRSGS